MADFEKLNRETKEHNNGISRNISPTTGITRYGTVEYWRNYYNTLLIKENRQK